MNTLAVKFQEGIVLNHKKGSRRFLRMKADHSYLSSSVKICGLLSSDQVGRVERAIDAIV